MDRNDRISTDGHPENTNRELHMQPGQLEDIESAEAYATRTGQSDATSPMSGRGTSDGDVTGRVTEGESIGGGQRAMPADGLHGADGHVREGEDVGHGIQAHAADGAYTADGHVQRGDDIGGGIRARHADEQDPGNPLV